MKKLSNEELGKITGGNGEATTHYVVTYESMATGEMTRVIFGTYEMAVSFCNVLQLSLDCISTKVW